MQSKQWYAFIALLLLVVMAIYFYLHPSYRLSLEAKIFYTIKEYENAYEVASSAYELNHYNNMAFTIMVQSKNALRHEAYIKRAKEYYERIEQISAKDTVSSADKIRIKMLCEVILAEYKKLNPTRLTDKELVQEAKQQNDRFQTLYDSIFG